MDFRQDINALRAVAVLSVLFYHFGLPGFSGGFVGVDVFFVISGYLMTSIIATRLAENRFSLIDFYLARGRRIIPALAVLVTALICLGWFVLPPSDYATMGWHGASSSLFFSNFVYKGEEGYFDAPSRTKWLLHTWSLSAEWQFYLIYPLILAAVTRWKKSPALAIGLLALGSAALSASLSDTKPAFAFFLLPTRLWEMALGGLVFWASARVPPEKTVRGLMAFAGYAVITLSVLCFSHNTSWPGYAALAPTLGTALVILARYNHAPIPYLSAAIQNTGRISYSLYLWHWPCVVMLGFLDMAGSPAATAIGILTSFLLALLSYQLVEEPLRRSTLLGTRRQALYWLGAMTVVPFALGVGIFLADGVTARVSPQVLAYENASKDRFTPDGHCIFDKKENEFTNCPVEKADFVVWGDSHAGALFSAVEAAAKQKSGILLTYSSCPTIFGASVITKTSKDICPAFNETAYDLIHQLKKGSPVIISNRFSYYLSGQTESNDRRLMLAFSGDRPAGINDNDFFISRLSESLCQIASSGYPVYVVKPIPEMPVDVPRQLARSAMLFWQKTPVKDISVSLDEYNSRHEIVLEALEKARHDCGVRLLDPAPILCAGGLCRSHDEKTVFYFDDDHLSESGNKKLVPIFAPVFRK